MLLVFILFYRFVINHSHEMFSATPNIQSFQFSTLVYFKNISLAQLYLHPKTVTSFFIITFSAILYTAHGFYLSNFIFSFNIVTQCYIMVYLFDILQLPQNKNVFYLQAVNLHLFTWYLQIPNVFFLIILFDVVNRYLIYEYYVKNVLIFLSLVFNCNI